MSVGEEWEGRALPEESGNLAIPGCTRELPGSTGTCNPQLMGHPVSASLSVEASLLAWGQGAPCSRGRHRQKAGVCSSDVT